jgi:hypothetical protein
MVKPEDKSKVILLVAAIVLVLVFVVWNLMRTLGAADQKPAATTSPAFGLQPGQVPMQPLPAAPNYVPPPVSTPPPTASTDSAPTAMNVPAPDQVDPFRSPLPRKDYRGEAPRPAPDNRGTMRPMPGGNGGGGTPVFQPAPPKTTIEVKGVVYGGQSFAVIKVGDNTLNLRQGDEVSKDIWVKEIQPTMVVFATKDATIPVEIGGTYSAVFFPVRSERNKRTMYAERPVERVAERKVPTEPVVAEEEPIQPPKPPAKPKPAPRPMSTEPAPPIQPRAFPTPEIVVEKPKPRPAPTHEVAVDVPKSKPVAAVKRPAPTEAVEARVVPKPRKQVRHKPAAVREAVRVKPPVRQTVASEAPPASTAPASPTTEPAKPAKAIEYGPI